MSNITSHDVVTVCTPDEAKTLLTTMIMNYCKHNNVQIEPKKKLLELWEQIRKINYGLFCMEMIDPKEDNMGYRRFDITAMDVSYLKNGLFLFRFKFDSKYCLDNEQFESLYEQIGKIPFFELEDSDAGDFYYQELVNDGFHNVSGSWSEEAINFYKHFYYDSDYAWELLEDEDDEYGIADMVRYAIEKPAPSVKEIIIDPKEMAHIQNSNPEEFLRQRRLIADLALWDGWDPAQLQPYIDYLDGKEVNKEEVEEVSSDCLFNEIVASLEDFQE